MAVTLKGITEDNFIDAFNLKLKKDQEEFVSHPIRSLAQAYVYRDQCQPFGIYEDDRMVGYMMVIYDYDVPEYDIWHMMIDETQQGKGYGKAALLLGIERMKEEHHIQEMYTGVALGNEVAERLYESIGFQLTGLVENGMKELRYICK